MRATTRTWLRVRDVNIRLRVRSRLLYTAGFVTDYLKNNQGIMQNFIQKTVETFYMKANGRNKTTFPSPSHLIHSQDGPEQGPRHYA